MDAIMTPEFLVQLLTIVLAIGAAYGGIKSRLDNNNELIKMFLQLRKEDKEHHAKELDKLEIRIDKNHTSLSQRIDSLVGGKAHRAVPP